MPSDPNLLFCGSSEIRQISLPVLPSSTTISPSSRETLSTREALMTTSGAASPWMSATSAITVTSLPVHDHSSSTSRNSSPPEDPQPVGASVVGTSVVPVVAGAPVVPVPAGESPQLESASARPVTTRTEEREVCMRVT